MLRTCIAASSSPDYPSNPGGSGGAATPAAQGPPHWPACCWPGPGSPASAARLQQGGASQVPACRATQGHAREHAPPSPGDSLVILLLCASSVLSRFSGGKPSSLTSSLSDKSMQSNWFCEARRVSDRSRDRLQQQKRAPVPVSQPGSPRCSACDLRVPCHAVQVNTCSQAGGQGRPKHSLSLGLCPSTPSSAPPLSAAGSACDTSGW